MIQSSAIPVASEPAFTPHHRTLLEALDRAAEQAAQRQISLLYEGPADVASNMTYAELAQRVAALAAGLSAHGVAPREPVLLVFETGFDLLVAFFACQRLRAIPVPTHPPAGLRIDAGLARVAQLALRAQTRLCLTSDALAPIVRELSTRVEQQRVERLRVATVSELSAAASFHVAFTPAQPSDIAFVQFTSGSTGQPKGVMLSHANLTANTHTIGLALQITPSDVFVNWCPLYHDMGLIGNVLSSLCWQLPIALFSPMAFIREPGRWLRAIHTYRGTISTAPNFAYWLAVARVNGGRREGLDLSSWRDADLLGSELHTLDRPARERARPHARQLPRDGERSHTRAAREVERDPEEAAFTVHRHALGDLDDLILLKRQLLAGLVVGHAQPQRQPGRGTELQDLVAYVAMQVARVQLE